MQNPTGYAQVVDELQNGVVTRTYSWGLELISKLETGNSTRSFYGYDGHGSVRFLTSSAGTITDTYDYDAFGNLTNQTGTTPNNYLFAGEQYDPGLNLYYNRARYLNTSTGRFWSMDTEEGGDRSPLSLHKYSYAGLDPINQVDPSGHDFDLGSTIAAAKHLPRNVPCDGHYGCVTCLGFRQLGNRVMSQIIWKLDDGRASNVLPD